jgi:hypothetical protein
MILQNILLRIVFFLSPLIAAAVIYRIGSAWWAPMNRLSLAMVCAGLVGCSVLVARSILNDRGRAISLLGGFLLLLAAVLASFLPLYEHAVI